MNPSQETRPWGSFTTFVKNEESTVKLIYVSAGETLSLQRHEHREEFWKVMSGHPELTIGDDIRTADPDEEFTIPAGTQHRIAAPSDDVVILEISKGDFDEDDIVRLDDKYGRV